MKTEKRGKVKAGLGKEHDEKNGKEIVLYNKFMKTTAESGLRFQAVIIGGGA